MSDASIFNCDKDDFVIPNESPWKEKMRLFDLYQVAYTPWEWHREKFDLSKSIGLEIISSPFDFSAIDFLEELDCVDYKIACPKISDIGLIERAAQTNKPVMLSSGATNLEDLLLAVKTLKDNGCKEYIFQNRTNDYSASPELCDLSTIAD